MRGPLRVDSDPHQERDVILSDLLTEVQRTRARTRELLDGARGGNASVAVVAAREEARSALELYVVALRRLSFPVPPRINAELALMRGLCATPRAYQS